MFVPLRLRVTRLGEHFWIVGDEEEGPYGPYDNRKEAETDKRGLLRTDRETREWEVEQALLKEWDA